MYVINLLQIFPRVATRSIFWHGWLLPEFIQAKLLYHKIPPKDNFSASLQFSPNHYATSYYTVILMHHSGSYYLMSFLLLVIIIYGNLTETQTTACWHCLCQNQWFPHCTTFANDNSVVRESNWLCNLHWFFHLISILAWPPFNLIHYLIRKSGIDLFPHHTMHFF